MASTMALEHVIPFIKAHGDRHEPDHHEPCGDRHEPCGDRHLPSEIEYVEVGWTHSFPLSYFSSTLKMNEEVLQCCTSI